MKKQKTSITSFILNDKKSVDTAEKTKEPNNEELMSDRLPMHPVMLSPDQPEEGKKAEV